MRLFFILTICGLLLAGCSGVRGLGKADVTMPETFVAGTAPDSLSIADIEWYRFYTDSTLCHIIERTLAHNHDLRQAAARVERMRALYGVEKAAALPEVSALAGGFQERTDYAGSGMKGSPELSLKASLNWEINLWGAQIWAAKKGKAAYLASVDDWRAMRMTLVAEAAAAYFNMVALDNELTIVKATLFTRSEALEKARIRFEGGLTSEIVYQQAMVEYSSTASLIPDLERRITLSRNALTLLMGDYPDDDIPRGTLAVHDRLPVTVETGFPSTLLQRRPDLRAAEHRLKGAMANVGLTYANRFPSFRISATGGLENDALSQFLRSPYTYILGNLAGTLFDFGNKKKQYKAAVAEYDEARLAYEKAVTVAFTEVNGALVAYNKYREAYKRKEALRDAAWEYVRLAGLQYRGGSLNYIDVLDAQRRYFEAQMGVNNALRDQYLALVNLYKALGGGWSVSETGR